MQGITLNTDHIKPGKVVFNVKNISTDENHELLLAKAESPATLPMDESGARVDEDKLKYLKELGDVHPGKMRSTTLTPRRLHMVQVIDQLGRLLIRDPGAKAVIGDLVHDHRRLAELTRKFAGAVSNAARDVQLPREWLDALAKEYLLANRLHMQVEEEHFLPRAMALLTEDDWAAIDERLAHADDPVFGEKVAEAYLYLHDRVLKLHEINPLVRQPYSD